MKENLRDQYESVRLVWLLDRAGRVKQLSLGGLQAVAAVLQQDQSAIVTLKSSRITRPAQLDGKVYASYGARCAAALQLVVQKTLLHMQRRTSSIAVHCSISPHVCHEVTRLTPSTKRLEASAAPRVLLCSQIRDLKPVICRVGRYEGRIVQQMILNDGGKGTYKEETPDMLGIWGALIKVGLSTKVWEASGI